MPTKYAFAPDYAVAPGETLRELLEAKGISQADLACRTGLTEKTISQIINSAGPISYETADKLELALGAPARFWNNRELAYREAIVRQEQTIVLESATAWLKGIPVKVLIQRELVNAKAAGADLVREALKFFGVSSVDAWHTSWGEPCVQFRGGVAQQRKPGFVAAWLRMGEIQAESVEVRPYDAAAFKRALSEVRKLTTSSPATWSTEIGKFCAQAGVAAVFTKEIEGAGVSGAARWITKDKALIQLSLRYKTDDQLWFTFFHEAAHILLHGKKQVFVEFGPRDDTKEEHEANAFARDWLIPPSHAVRLGTLRSRQQICAFATAIGVSPGVVVGRLQHDKLAYQSAFNDLKIKLKWN